MALQRNQFKVTNTKPEGKFSPAWTCSVEQSSPWEIWRSWENCSETRRRNRADAAEKMLCSITGNPEKLMGTLDPRKEILDHTNRPAGWCWESQGMFKRVNHTYLTPKKPPKSVMKMAKNRYALTVTHWGKELPHVNTMASQNPELEQLTIIKLIIPHVAGNIAIFAEWLLCLWEREGKRWAQGKRIIMAGKDEQTGKMMQRMNT